MTQLEKRLSEELSINDMNELIIDTYHECMEAFLSTEDDCFLEEINEIIEDNLGFECSYTELFQAYDNIQC
jgi:hypothetical protein